MMKKILLLAFVLISSVVYSQELRLLRGAITDNLVVNDTVNDTYSLYLPSNFEVNRPWPVAFVMDLKGKGKAAVSILINAAEQEGYVLASSNNLSDSLAISENVLIANRMFNAVFNTIPTAKNRTYTAGFGSGAMFASILPTFVREIKGVISIGASVGNVEILNTKQPFQFIGLVNRSDYNFTSMYNTKQVLNKLKFPNELLVFDGARNLPEKEIIAKAFRMLTLTSMAKGHIQRNDSLIKSSYDEFLVDVNKNVSNQKPLLATYQMFDMEKIFYPLMKLDSLKASQKVFKRSTSYRQANRSQNSYFLKESFTKEDYGYYLEEDIISYNYANLGWWNFQMEELNKLDKSSNLFERQMSSRLRGYINALVSDNIDYIAADEKVDFEALNLLYMIKTITAPAEHDGYLKVISMSSKMEDYGTALFYLEELLKNGYTDKEGLYDIEHTSLFRIMPEFNEVVEKYLKGARYDVIEQ
ncbi:alpha/beta hydrolase [Maribacter sp. BPC-D8]|uniref:alpha/beta hydrolase n=1 Tax=Maribacter sp. BPC-D8 TaxID=3053613 RepID=UPI002B45A886|nr:alpha/beta hydrolase [Maribacter sp. BPC-D8]WRI27752.1 alpha/beta hydrolase [Maribacter sp. BPC-D8]